MDMYWVYELHSWQFGVLTVGLLVSVSLSAFVLTRSWIRSSFRLSDATNEPVSGFFSGVGVFYGLLLGQVAVTAWQNVDNADALISREATEADTFYRNISVMPEPYKTRLQDGVRDYLHYMVEVVWPAHQHGDSSTEATVIITRMHKVLSSFAPGNEGEKIIFAAAYMSFNKFLEARHLRIDSVRGSLPTELWVVVILGGVLNIGVTFFFHMRDRKAHYFLTGALAVFVGLMIFLVATMDDPFRGPNGVSPESYQRVLSNLDKLDPAFLN
ncbi:DUF4239 domain-containing protein [Candidatus Methylospira mobilis]|uniref:DUF4239 domain-containing protein n=1 Tax=Candidatus Methylospira mobilis TaxID=1808979 RepID=A0A5Q0BHV0_9GAMM|nr:DUF4239 domain-containing protein [Candidatus Methylospira mobilis]QFY41734.1 DUF4239 domain-containing protein [Candidatus Methylospira mobilis]WNV06590.1 DUF4239 domain-containing protein [Candidatus Methylospira mobilis]